MRSRQLADDDPVRVSGQFWHGREHNVFHYLDDCARLFQPTTGAAELPGGASYKKGSIFF